MQVSVGMGIREEARGRRSGLIPDEVVASAPFGQVVVLFVGVYVARRFLSLDPSVGLRYTPRPFFVVQRRGDPPLEDLFQLGQDRVRASLCIRTF